MRLICNSINSKSIMRAIIALKLLKWSFSIMPDCDFKIQLANFIKNNLSDESITNQKS